MNVVNSIFDVLKCLVGFYVDVEDYGCCGKVVGDV